MPLLLTLTDPETGAVWPNAYTLVTEAHVSIKPDAPQAVLMVMSYASAAAHAAGLQPLRPPESLNLSQAEQQMLVSQFTAAVEAVLLARSEFSKATQIA